LAELDLVEVGEGGELGEAALGQKVEVQPLFPVRGEQLNLPFVRESLLLRLDLATVLAAVVVIVVVTPGDVVQA
jgi:hypothetical protein